MKSRDVPTIVMVGDSLVRRLDGYVQSPHCCVINAGYGGDTASNALWRSQEMRLPSKASLGFVHVGVNDILRAHSSAGCTSQNIASTIMQCAVQLKMLNPMMDVVVYKERGHRERCCGAGESTPKSSLLPTRIRFRHGGPLREV